ncbi:MAG: hemolysin family protein [Actinomycetaceae bacterium]|nr:hemolysin family protein [Actinomycetaceae bacterium]
MSSSVAIVLSILLLLINAFFVGAEFAVTSSRRAQIEPMVAAGRRGAKDALYAVEHVSLMLATCQLGITLASTGLGVVAEPAIAGFIEGPLVAAGLPQASAHVFGFAGALLIVLYLHVVIGEMVPKNISVTMHTKVILIYGPAIVRVAHVLRPVVEGMDHLANWILRRFGVEPKAEVASTFTAEEVASIVELSQAEGILEDDLGLLSGTLEFSEEDVRAVMLNPEELVTLPVDCTPDQLQKEVARTGFSRFPVKEASGEIVGYLHLKDLLYAEGEDRLKPVPHWKIRALPEVEPDIEVEDALRAMQISGTHLAKVVTQNQVVGVIFLEDILEELVGEVRDAMQREER